MYYLSGGMGLFGKDRFNEANEWRVYFKSKIEELSGGKIKVFNPNDHFSFLDEITDEKESMEYDLYKLRNSDLVIVNYNDPNSIGTVSEVATAYENRIPVIGLCEHGELDILHPWLKYFCSKIFTDREELLLYIVKHYLNGD